MPRKEGVRPALIVRASAASAFLLAFPQNATQPHASPFVESSEHGRISAVLEVCKPASKRERHAANDHHKTMAVRALRFGTDRSFQLLDTLFSRPAVATFEVISEKVETFSFLLNVHDSGLLRM